MRLQLQLYGPVLAALQASGRPDAKPRPDPLAPCGLARRRGGLASRRSGFNARQGRDGANLSHPGHRRLLRNHINPARGMDVVIVLRRGRISVLSLDHINTISSFEGVSAACDIQRWYSKRDMDLHRNVAERLREPVPRVLDSGKRQQTWLKNSTGTKLKAEGTGILAELARVLREAEGLLAERVGGGQASRNRFSFL